MKVGVIDYGTGNLGSLSNALQEIKATPVLIDRPIDLHTVGCLILPGVGNFSEAMRLMRQTGWDTAIKDEVLSFKRPILGICLGMQLLADFSSEGASLGGENQGLGLIPGRVVHLGSIGCKLRIPHVGWNSVSHNQTEAFIFKGIPQGTDFYFVHSYVFKTSEESSSVAFTDYGASVCAAVGGGHIWGVQFHPEKSSKAGLQVLKNFIQGPQLC